jgi:glyoxylase-like metal-dependent hydrolase (beta-lactamase superfamily II)
MPTTTLFVIGGCSGSFSAPSENRPIYDLATPERFHVEPCRREVYGGRTTSYFLRHQDTFVIVDQGLGVEVVAEIILDMLAAEQKTSCLIHCLQTHFHHDHWSGVQANSLLFRKGLTLRFYSPELVPSPAGGPPIMEKVLEVCFPPEKHYWPVNLALLDQIGARREHVSFRPGEALSLDGLVVQTMPLIHPNGCSGYRFEIPGVGPVVVATDYEPPEQPDPAVVEFLDGARLVLADMQYSDAEYEGKAPIGRFAMPRRGWGHGTPSRLFPLWLRCRRTPQMVRVVHHDPKRSDEHLRRFCEETSLLLCNDYGAAGRLDYEFGRDGDRFWL